jgi:DNA mismatch repair ATPase MutS
MDEQTLRELEIFTDAGGGGGVCGLIDSTRTRLGHQALKKRLLHPYVETGDIRSVQCDLAFLRLNKSPVPYDDELLQGSDRYARSLVEVTDWERPGSRLSGWRRAIRYRDVFAELSRGIVHVTELARRVSDHCLGLLSHSPEGNLERVLRDAAESAHEVVAAAAAGGAGTAWSVVRSDARLRGVARDRMVRLVAAAAELDAMASLAAFGEGSACCLPEVAAGEPRFAAEGLYHPLLAQPVGNAIRLDREHHVVFLTGPNMAGKTTFLKSIGVAQVLAQAGLLAPAQVLRLAPVEALFTALNTADDLTAGVSYYLAEVRRMRQVAEGLATGERALVLVDEAFRGTNVLDATEATRLVIAGFGGVTNSSFLVASHLSSLAPELEARGASLKSFWGEVRGGAARYDYRIADGVSDQRLGLLLLEQEGVLRLLSEASRKGIDAGFESR